MLLFNSVSNSSSLNRLGNRDAPLNLHWNKILLKVGRIVCLTLLFRELGQNHILDFLDLRIGVRRQGLCMRYSSFYHLVSFRQIQAEFKDFGTNTNLAGHLLLELFNCFLSLNFWYHIKSSCEDDWALEEILAKDGLILEALSVKMKSSLGQSLN